MRFISKEKKMKRKMQVNVSDCSQSMLGIIFLFLILTICCDPLNIRTEKRGYLMIRDNFFIETIFCDHSSEPSH